MNSALERAIEHWKYVAPLASRPLNQVEYEQRLSHLDTLLDIIGDNENHPLIGLVDILSEGMSAYEAQQVEEPRGRGTDALRYLMEVHHLYQSDLPEVGSQGVVSEILHGHRALNLRQIKALAERFGVNPETFID